MERGYRYITNKHFYFTKVSRQLKEALHKVEEVVSHKEYKVIETQDVIMGILSVIDKASGYALGYHVTSE